MATKDHPDSAPEAQQTGEGVSPDSDQNTTATRAMEAGSDDYQDKMQREIENFTQIENVHALPQIFYYWAHNYLRPKFLEMEVRGIQEFFFDNASKACRRPQGLLRRSVAAMTSNRPPRHRIISIGSGHSDIEVDVTAMLLEAGIDNFVLECMDVVPAMLEHARASAEARGVADHMDFVLADAATWEPAPGSYTMVMAHQSLHHIVDLEVLFTKIREAIGTNGVFLTSDIIGRNGHMRWPEAMVEIERIWPDLDDRYKYNHALSRFEPMYENWDCSTEGFEGIRAQDILPLLCEHFHFEMFLGYGNLTDIFVDRAFGHNFDPDKPEDCAAIDMIAQLDDAMIESGDLKPTHIVAIMRGGPVRSPRYYKHLTPEFCIRPV